MFQFRLSSNFQGTLEIPKYDFDMMFDKFSSLSMLTKPEAISALCKAQYECMEVRSKSMFHVPISKHMRLEEFEQTQSMMTVQVALFLKVSNFNKFFDFLGKLWRQLYGN